MEGVAFHACGREGRSGEYEASRTAGHISHKGTNLMVRGAIKRGGVGVATMWPRVVNDSVVVLGSRFWFRP